MAQLDAAFWFEIADETRSLSDIPADVSKAVLDFLNAATTPDEIAYSVPLLDSWTATPIHSLAIFQMRGAGFTSLDEVWRVPGLGPARFTEVVRSIAKTDTAIISLFDFRDSSPQQTISSSETELKFEYEYLLPGPLNGTLGRYPQPLLAPSHGSRCCANASSCSLAPGSFNMQLSRHEAQIDITGLLLFGENDDTKVSIRMDHRLRPYDFMRPIDQGAPDIQFPAVMQLNNSMIIDLEIKATTQRFSLIARDVPCQIGRCMNWPPHQTLLFTTEPLLYYDSKDPLGPPIIKIRDATTFLRGPENFLSARPKFDAYEFLPRSSLRGLAAIVLMFEASLGGTPVAIDHYIIYRSQDPRLGEGSWSNVSGPLFVGQWIDANPPPGPLYYRLVPVVIDSMRQPYEGFAGQVLRVEPADSIFR